MEKQWTLVNIVFREAENKQNNQVNMVKEYKACVESLRKAKMQSLLTCKVKQILSVWLCTAD